MRIWIAMLLGLVFLNCGSDDGSDRPDRPGTIEGSVSRIEDGSPVSGARVILVEAASVRPVTPSLLTNDLGRYRFEDVPPGDYALFVYTNDLVVFDRSHPTVRLEAGATAVQNMRFLVSNLWDGSGYRVAGTVRNASTGEPIGGAFVSGAFFAWNDVPYCFQGYGLPEWGVTDEDGRFSVTVSVLTDEQGNETGLEPISVTREGFRPSTLVGNGPRLPELAIRAIPVPEPPDSVVNCEIRLQPDPAGGPDPRHSGAIRGRAVESGRGVAGLRVAVSLFSSDHHDSLTAVPLGAQSPIQGNVTVTDAHGDFVLSGLAPGIYGVHPGYLDGDGYGLIETPMVRVAAADTANAGDFFLVRAIRPTAPAEGTTLSDTTPLFRWESYGDSVDVYIYSLMYATSHSEWSVVADLSEPRWQVPDANAFAPGARVRWKVEVRRRDDAKKRSGLCGIFEHVATFIVRG